MKTLRIAILSLLALSFANCTGRKLDPNKKILRLALREEVKHGDPNQASDVVSAEFNGHIFEGLMTFAYLGRPDQVQPLLAENFPEKRDNGRTLAFRIKKKVYFADDPAFPNGKGRELQATDFIYSLKRLADPKTDSANWWAYDGMVEGFNAWREALAATKTPEEYKVAFEKPIAGLQAPSPYVFIIRLTKAYPQLPYILSMTHSSAVAREVVEKYGPEIISHPVGTGPFRLREWVRGSKIILERNENFREDFYPNVGTEEARQQGLLKSAAKKIPFADEIHFDIIKEDQPRWLKFKTGDLDAALIPKDFFSDSIGADGELKPELKDKGVKLHKSLTLTTWWLEFNHKDPLLGGNLKLRQALATGFNRRRALEVLHNNRGVLANTYFPPNIEGGRANIPYPYEYNLEKAKKLLAEAGYPEGKGLPELAFDTRGPATVDRQLGEIVQDDFSRLGIKVKILANSYPEAIEKQRKSRFQMILGGWAGDYPDPENYLQNFYGPNAAPNSNSSNYKNKDFDRLYLAMRVQTPSADRESNIRKMVEILHRDAVVALFFTQTEYYVTQAPLLNFYQNPVYYGKGKFLDLKR